ncbi:MAG: aspartyl protease family protein [Longimicrobiales bacterium]
MNGARRSERRLRLATGLIMAAVTAGCALLGRVAESEGDLFARLMPLLESQDYFRLRDALDALPRPLPPRALLFEAAVLHAFNSPEASLAATRRALARPGLTAPVVARLHRLELRNALRLHDYPAAAAAVSALLAGPTAALDSIDRENAQDILKFARALEDVPPQQVVRERPTSLRIGSGRVTVEIRGRRRGYLLDTGAGLSVMTQTEAASLRLAIRAAGIRIGTATDLKIEADLAVVDTLRLGGFTFTDVVFLVVPDALLRFTEEPLPGVIGFPVIEALGVVRLYRDGRMNVTSRSEPGPSGNLALHQLVPLVRVRWRDHAFVCRLDTGATGTVMYEPFFRAHADWVEAVGRADTVRTSGLGGSRMMPAYIVPSMTLALGDTSITLLDVGVYRRQVDERDDDPLFCNIGVDALEAFEERIIDFRSMYFLLR